MLQPDTPPCGPGRLVLNLSFSLSVFLWAAHDQERRTQSSFSVYQIGKRRDKKVATVSACGWLSFPAIVSLILYTSTHGNTYYIPATFAEANTTRSNGNACEHNSWSPGDLRSPPLLLKSPLSYFLPLDSSALPRTSLCLTSFTLGSSFFLQRRSDLPAIPKWLENCLRGENRGDGDYGNSINEAGSPGEMAVGAF